MLTASLQEIDGAVVLAVPEAVLQMLDLKAGSVVALNVPQKRPRYTLQELLDQCDFSLPVSEEDRLWMESPPIGDELL